jgi:thiamine biosynthesis lipoprotein
MQHKQTKTVYSSARSVSNLLLLAVALVSVGGCRATKPESPTKRFEFQQPHMGTLFTITLYAPDELEAQSAATAAFARVAQLNQMMTDYDPDSELMRLSRSPVGQPVRVSAELFEVLAESQRLAKSSGGAFDVTIGPLVRLWRRTRRTETLPTPEQLAVARASVGWEKLQLDARNRTVTLLAPNMQLDLGGIAKGYAADQALAVLKSRGINRALVAASGDIAVGEAPPGQAGWRVTIGTPFSREGAEPPLILKHAAVSTSGDAEQSVVIAGKRYSHIVDPRTGLGLTDRCQVSIVAARAMRTDAFATTVSILGADQGRKLIESEPGLSAIIYRETAAGWKIITVNRRQ